MPVVILSDLKIARTAKEIEEYFETQTEKGLEGIMAKKLDGVYRAGARDFNWIKYKRSYSGKLTDTIDA
ncbi:DNA ligase, partial [Candidatus Gottesmanbacteria bacterium]|nr:DNA ligase [Candidatus Gottesmanbacteria bacterium]